MLDITLYTSWKPLRIYLLVWSPPYDVIKLAKSDPIKFRDIVVQELAKRGKHVDPAYISRVNSKRTVPLPGREPLLSSSKYMREIERPS